MKKMKFVSQHGNGEREIYVDERLNVGTVVRVKSGKYFFDTYQDAFRLFKIENYAEKKTHGDLEWFSLKPKTSSLKKNWVILDLALHPTMYNTVVVLLKNCHNEYLVVDSHGLDYRNKKLPNIKKEKFYYLI